MLWGRNNTASLPLAWALCFCHLALLLPWMLQGQMEAPTAPLMYQYYPDALGLVLSLQWEELEQVSVLIRARKVREKGLGKQRDLNPRVK